MQSELRRIIKAHVTKNIKPDELEVTIAKTTLTKAGDFVKCNAQEDSNNIQKGLVKKLGREYEVSSPKTKLHRIKIKYCLRRID